MQAALLADRVGPPLLTITDRAISDPPTQVLQCTNFKCGTGAGGSAGRLDLPSATLTKIMPNVPKQLLPHFRR